MTTTQKYFGTDGIRGRVGDSVMNPEFVLKLGWAAGKVFSRQLPAKVLIGKDTRISGYLFESALEAGLSAAGVDIQLLGPMPTPAIAYLTRTLRAQVGIVISASHNPYYDNGIKFFSNSGSKLCDALEQAIEEVMTEPLQTVAPERLGKVSRVKDAAGRYIEFCKGTVPQHLSLSGMKIIVDCANGATYHVAPPVFHELGAEVIDVGVKPNGLNINEKVGSTHPETLQKKVMAENAHLGIAFDGDGDRVVMVDEKGEIVDGDEMLFILAKERVATKRKIAGIVGTVMSNLGLENAVRGLGLDFVRAKVGDRYVIEALQAEQWELGGEKSGHLVCLDVTTTGDGIIAALQVLGAMVRQNKTLHELKKGMTKFPQTILNVRQNRSGNVIEQETVQQAVRKAEGRLNGRGRVLLRPSGTEPVIRVMVEGEDGDEVKKIAEELAQIVKKCSLD